MEFILWTKISYFLKDFWGYLILLAVSFLILIFAVYKIFKLDKPLRLKNSFLALIFAAFLIVLSFTACEAYFRFRYDKSDGLGFLKTHQRWLARHVVYNSDFVRDRDFTIQKPEDTKRIAVLGDSLTFGAGIENVNHRFSNLLEKKLNDNGQKVQVYNLGVPGYNTEQEIQKYNDAKKYNFDLIILAYFLNDIQPTEASTGTPIINKSRNIRGAFTHFLSDYSYFFDFLYWRLSSQHAKVFSALKTADLDQYKNQEVLKKHEETISNFLKDSKADNKKVVVLIFPYFAAWGKDYPAQWVEDLMADYFSSNGADTTIDLMSDLKGKTQQQLIANRFDSHPNEYVNSVAAQKLFEKVSSLLNR